MKRAAINVLKVSLSVAIIGYVLLEAQRDNSFERLRDQPKHWELLGVAGVLALGAVCVSFLRWYVLVRAIGLPLRIRDVFRLGFLGYLLNFVSLGSVGGDLFKAVFLAREHPARRAHAVATVLVDRMTGTFSLVLLAAAAVLSSGLYQHSRAPEVQWIARTALVAGAVGILLLAALIVPAATGPVVGQAVVRLPWIGRAVGALLRAVQMYRRRPAALVAASLMSLATHCLFVLTVYAIAMALPGRFPTLAEHFVIVPLSMMAAALPLPLGALGALEAALDFLYAAVGGSHQGLVVALCYRLVTVAIATVGACFYLLSRREVVSVLQDAEATSEDFAALDAPLLTPASSRRMN